MPRYVSAPLPSSPMGTRVELDHRRAGFPCYGLRQLIADCRLAEQCRHVVFPYYLDQSRNVLRRGLHISRQGRYDQPDYLEPVELCEVGEGCHAT